MTERVDVTLIRSCLAEFSSEREQRRLWLSDGQDGREVGSLAEAYCCHFDDSRLGPELERGRSIFDQATDTEFKRLDSLLERIDGERPSSEIIADPAMMDVRAVASRLLERMNH